MAAPTRAALVTGAGGGIGRAVVARLLRDGYGVAAVDRAVAGIPCGDDSPVELVSADVTAPAQVSAAIARARARFGRIDAVVHLAGAVGQGPLVDVTLEEWQRLLDVNLTSAFLLAQASHAALRESRGTLLLASSTNARNGGSALSGPAYAVAKAGLVNLSRYLAKEWGPDGIRVNCIAPGPVDTPMLARLPADTLQALEQAIPLGRIATVRDVAGTVAFLCSADAAYLTGIVLNVSGGLVLD